MIIKYEDVILRAIEIEDLELIREMINDPEIEHMTGGGGFPVSKHQQENWFKSLEGRNNEIRLMIETGDCGAIGMVMLTDIDYKNSTAQFHFKIATSKNMRGKGYGTKATNALIRYAFDHMNLNCIFSHVIEYNIASQRVHEKCGFKREGILRKRVYKGGKYHDIVVFSILKDELQ